MSSKSTEMVIWQSILQYNQRSSKDWYWTIFSPFFSYFWNLELFRKYYLYFYYKVVPFKYTSRKFNKLKVKSWEIDLLYIGSLSGNYDDFSKSEINDFRKTTRWDRELGILNRIIWFWLWSGGDAFWKKEKKRFCILWPEKSWKKLMACRILPGKNLSTIFSHYFSHETRYLCAFQGCCC